MLIYFRSTIFILLYFFLKVVHQKLIRSNAFSLEVTIFLSNSIFFETQIFILCSLFFYTFRHETSNLCIQYLPKTAILTKENVCVYSPKFVNYFYLGY
jgi:hypothetical protein